MVPPTSTANTTRESPRTGARERRLRIGLLIGRPAGQLRTTPADSDRCQAPGLHVVEEAADVDVAGQERRRPEEVDVAADRGGVVVDGEEADGLGVGPP